MHKSSTLPGHQIASIPLNCIYFRKFRKVAKWVINISSLLLSSVLVNIFTEPCQSVRVSVCLCVWLFVCLSESLDFVKMKREMHKYELHNEIQGLYVFRCEQWTGSKIEKVKYENYKIGSLNFRPVNTEYRLILRCSPHAWWSYLQTGLISHIIRLRDNNFLSAYGYTLDIIAPNISQLR